MTSDVNQVQNGLNMTLRLLLRSPFIVIGAIIMAFTISPALTGWFLLITAAIALVIWLIMRATVPVYHQSQTTLDRVTLLTRENYVGARVVRAFSRQKDEMADFAAANDRLRDVQLAAGRISALMNPVTYLIVNLGVIAVLWNGGRQVDTGALTQGEIIALINYLSQILLSLLRMADLVISVTRAIASAVRVTEVLEHPHHHARPRRAGTGAVPDAPAVAFEGVGFTYSGARRAQPDQHHPGRRPRRDHRRHRRHRQRQNHLCQPDPPLLRCHRAAGCCCSAMTCASTGLPSCGG